MQTKIVSASHQQDFQPLAALFSAPVMILPSTCGIFSPKIIWEIFVDMITESHRFESILFVAKLK